MTPDALLWLLASLLALTAAFLLLAHARLLRVVRRAEDLLHEAEGSLKPARVRPRHILPFVRPGEMPHYPE
jgi:hypothetical protein